MLRRLALAALLALAPALALADPPMIAPTAAPGDNSNRIATTAFVASATGGNLALLSGRIFIGSAGNVAVGQPVSGDCTISIAGAVTCTQSAGAFTINGIATITGGVLQTNIAAPTTPAAGKTQIYVDSTQKVLSSKNDAGTVSNTVVPSTCSANQFGASVSAAGVFGCAQPAVSNLSGFGTGVATVLGLATNVSGGIVTPTPTRAGDVVYWNGSAWATLPGNNSGTQFFQENASGVPSWATVAGTGTVTSIVCNGVTITTSGTCPSAFFPTNCTLAASVATNILTVALKDSTGADASATSPCYIPFRSATATNGSTTFDSVTAALSITTNATGATLGSSNATAFRFWVVAFDNAGTVVLSLFNASTATQCFSINEGAVQSSTAISGTATAAGTYYTPNGTTLASKAVKIMGYVEYNSTGLVTAGTYATAPNFIQTFGPGVKRPCDPVKTVYAQQATGQAVTGTTIFSALSSSITPDSAVNLIKGAVSGDMSSSTSAGGPFVGLLALSRGACSATIASAPNSSLSALTASTTAGNNTFGPASAMMFDKPNTASAQAYNVCLWNTNAANTVTWPQNPGTLTNQIGTFTLDEIMG